jgi:hypothetical protein
MDQRRRRGRANGVRDLEGFFDGAFGVYAARVIDDFYAGGTRTNFRAPTCLNANGMRLMPPSSRRAYGGVFC